jgi:hypothetical protein
MDRYTVEFSGTRKFLISTEDQLDNAVKSVLNTLPPQLKATAKVVGIERDINASS